MTRLTYLLLLAGFSCLGQSIPTNRPEIVNPILELFKMDAGIRGIPYTAQLAKIDSITVKPYGDLAGAETISYANGHFKIVINESKIGDSKSAYNAANTIRLYHELGHVFGIVDCYLCSYNIMSANASDRATYLYRDAYIRLDYNDKYFKAIEDPKHYNANHTHY